MIQQFCRNTKQSRGIHNNKCNAWYIRHAEALVITTWCNQKLMHLHNHILNYYYILTYISGFISVNTKIAVVSTLMES